MELSKNATSLAGEFAVLSQLFLRGFDANLTLGNTKSVDILASYPVSGRMLKLEVKTRLGNRPETSRLFGRTLSWVMSKKHEAIVDKDLFYCFVNIAPDTRLFDFYIVSSSIVARYVRDQHRVWLGQSDIDNRKRRDSDIRRFRLALDDADYPVDTPMSNNHQEKWELLLSDL